MQRLKSHDDLFYFPISLPTDEETQKEYSPLLPSRRRGPQTWTLGSAWAQVVETLGVEGAQETGTLQADGTQVAWALEADGTQRRQARDKGLTN